MFNDSNPDKFKVKSIEDIKSENRKFKKVREIRGKKRLITLLILTCLAILTFVGFKLSRRSLIVSVNNNKIGIVASNSDIVRIKEELRKEIVSERGVEDIEFNETILTEKAKYDENLISPDSKILEGFRTNLTYRIKAITIETNEEERVVLEKREQLNRILNKLKDEYNKEEPYIDFMEKQEMLSTYFYGNVRLGNRIVDEKEIMTDDVALEILKQIEPERTYTVKANDTIWTIAEANKMDVQDLLKVNEGFTETEILNVGQKVKLSVSLSTLPVIYYKEQSHELVIEPTVEKIIRDDKYEDYKEVIEPGKEGRKRATVKIKMVGNTEMDKEIIKEEVIEEATKKVIEVGSKELPNNAQTGLFTTPTRGILTSGFWEYRDGYYHKGIDLANSLGTPIYASYTGKVTFAGEKNGFGKIVIIEHSNGYETYYAHLSKILVSKGDKVDKGEIIAEMGSTGNSTGSHLHFEVHKDGEVKNPFNYIG